MSAIRNGPTGSGDRTDQFAIGVSTNPSVFPVSAIHKSPAICPKPVASRSLIFVTVTVLLVLENRGLAAKFRHSLPWVNRMLPIYFLTIRSKLLPLVNGPFRK
ncbi:MAG TPA: hypothetical protein VM260_17700, partial [Pirellula sp.]|nr:hypothetical protein [Pirellula sp.]